MPRFSPNRPSRAEGYGRRFAANVVEPPTISRAAAEEMERLMAAARVSGSPDAEREAAARCARLARSDQPNRRGRTAIGRRPRGFASVIARGATPTARPATTPSWPIAPAIA